MLSPRTARAVVSLGDRWLGAVAPFAVSSPWWADVEPVTAELDRRLGVRTTVLRLVDVEGGAAPAGGLVTYHVEVAEEPRAGLLGQLASGGADGVDGVEATEPRRASYARPGGPASDLAWAAGRLRALGRPPTAPPVQVKTWNLSCVHRLATTRGAAWLKVVNGFQTPESVPVAAIAAVDPTLVPVALGADPVRGRFLADEAPGEDCWDIGDLVALEAVDRWVAVQASLASTSSTAALVAAGVPDWSDSTLLERVSTQLLDSPTSDLDDAGRALAAQIARLLPERLRRITDAGLPQTLVHGDFQPGNWRSDGRSVVLMDWSDASLGHPALDLRSLGALSVEVATVVGQHWVARWRALVPGSDPAVAHALSKPMVHLRGALLYQHFLDHVEPSERRYHRGDPVAQLRLTLAAW